MRGDAVPNFSPIAGWPRPIFSVYAHDHVTLRLLSSSAWDEQGPLALPPRNPGLAAKLLHLLRLSSRAEKRKIGVADMCSRAFSLVCLARCRCSRRLDLEILS